MSAQRMIAYFGAYSKTDAPGGEGLAVAAVGSGLAADSEAAGSAADSGAADSESNVRAP
jgi:hypothetical protein